MTKSIKLSKAMEINTHLTPTPSWDPPLQRFNPRVVGFSFPPLSEDYFLNLHVTPEGSKILAEKGTFFAVRLSHLTRPQAHILKESLLSLGGDAALHKDVLVDRVDLSDVLLLGNLRQYGYLKNNLQGQPFKLPFIGQWILETLQNFLISEYRLPCLSLNQGKISLTSPPVLVLKIGQPLIMGILNVTPDSFSDGGLYVSPPQAIEQALALQEEGADLLDMGAESTRPGAESVSSEEEWNRLFPVLKELQNKIHIPLSIDTQKPEIARKAVEYGVSLINDVGGLQDPAMVQVVKETKASVVLMHRQGNPKTMQNNPTYQDVISDILLFFRKQLQYALDQGIEKDHIILDPGIGFGKTTAHNITLLQRLFEFRVLGCPILAGTSRKGFLGQLTGHPVQERLSDTILSSLTAASKGAVILRVHDVRPLKQSLPLLALY